MADPTLSDAFAKALNRIVDVYFAEDSRPRELRTLAKATYCHVGVMLSLFGTVLAKAREGKVEAFMKEVGSTDVITGITQAYSTMPSFFVFVLIISIFGFSFIVAVSFKYGSPLRFVLIGFGLSSAMIMIVSR